MTIRRPIATPPEPMDSTPMHPEYPCAHCIESGAAIEVIQSVLGSSDISAAELTSSTAPGVVHRWSDLTAFADEIANARVWAGFHYRSSGRVGTEMGQKIGRFVVQHAMQQTNLDGSR